MTNISYRKRFILFRKEYDQILANLTCQTSMDNIEQCDLIIEATVEDLYLKQQTLDKFEEYLPEHCIFACNTYVLSIDEIAVNSRRPDKVK